MSIRTTMDVVCDECGDYERGQVGLGGATPTASASRDLVKKSGWKVRSRAKGRDLCWRCAGVEVDG